MQLQIQEKWKLERDKRIQKELEYRELERMQVSGFNQWLENAKVGDSFCYFIGECLRGCAVGKLALDAYNNGYVTLYQKKIKSSKFAYWALRISQSAKPSW